MNKLTKHLKSALLMVALFGFLGAANGAWAATTSTASNASLVYGGSIAAGQSVGVGDTSGDSVLAQVYNIIRFAYLFFYAIAVLLVAQAWLQFKQQKYDQMFASMGAALGLFLTPAIIDFIHNLGSQTASA